MFRAHIKHQIDMWHSVLLMPIIWWNFREANWRGSSEDGRKERKTCRRECQACTPDASDRKADWKDDWVRGKEPEKFRL